MTKIYVVRHCETVGNARGLFQGVIDLEPNDLGKKQLGALAKRFQDVNIDVVVSSPLKRTKETAQAIVGSRDIPIMIDEEIIEFNGGIYEGVPFAEIANIDPTFPEIWSERPWDLEPPNGEKIVAAYERIWNAVVRIAKQHENETIVLSTHGGVTRFLLCRILKNDIKKLNEISYGDNTAVTLLEVDGDVCEAVYVNDASHLGEELKNPKAAVSKEIK